MTDRDTLSVFTRALNVMNSALEAHKDEKPYSVLIQATEKAMGERKLGVGVYESDPGNPFDYFTIRYREGSFELDAHGKKDPDLVWKVSRDYLEKVAADPQEYIDNPLKLDWDWLKSRVGVDL
jgi:hypothetical protein